MEPTAIHAVQEVTSASSTMLKGAVRVVEETGSETPRTGSLSANQRAAIATLPQPRAKCGATLELPFTLVSHSGAQFVCNKEVGRGGYSRCYRLRAENGSLFAVKAIPRRSLSSPAAQHRLETEINIHSRLEHPGIVALLESHYTSTHMFLVLELCPAGTLNDWIKQHRRMPEGNTRETLFLVADAVNYLHEKLIFHGDLKLSNILLDATMRPKLCDFGFAKQLRSVHQKRHNPYGTPSYMAREIIVPPRQFGLEADIWSLGVITYTLLYGVTPFDAETVAEVYNRIASLDLRFPATDPPISGMARAMIVRLLDARPECRPIAHELMADPWMRPRYQAMAPVMGLLPQQRLIRMFTKGFRRTKGLRRVRAPQ